MMYLRYSNSYFHLAPLILIYIFIFFTGSGIVYYDFDHSNFENCVYDYIFFSDSDSRFCQKMSFQSQISIIAITVNDYVDKKIKLQYYN